MQTSSSNTLRIGLLVSILIICAVAISATAQNFSSRVINNHATLTYNACFFQDSTVLIAGTASETKNVGFQHPLLNRLETNNNQLIDTFDFVFGKDTQRHFFLNDRTLKKTLDGGYVAVGGSSASLSYSEKGLFLKWNKDLKLLLKKEYVLPDSQAFSFDLQDVLELGDSSFLLLGMQYYTSPQYHVCASLLKVNKKGELLWSKVVKGPATDLFAKRLLADTDSSFLMVAGLGRIVPLDPTKGYSKMHIVRMDTSGEVINTWTGADPNIYEIKDVLKLANGEYVIAGAYRDSSFYNDRTHEGYSTFYGYVAGLDSDFKIRWERKMGQASIATYWNSIKNLSDGQLVLAGSTFDNSNDEKIYRHQGWLSSISRTGEVLWERKYNTAGNPEAESNELVDVLELPNKDIVSVGWSICQNEDRPQRAWLLRLDRFGCIVPGCESVGIREPEITESLMSIYPNPTDGDFIIHIAAAKKKNDRLVVMDVLGRVLVNKELALSDSYTIHSDDWPAGLYTVTFIGDKSNCTLKLIKGH